MKVTKWNKVYELQGDAWNEKRFNWLKSQNPKGKVCAIDIDGNKDKYLIPIGDLEIQEEPRNY